MRRKPLTLIALTYALVLVPLPAAAQDTDPTGSPVAPDPAECRVEPRPIEDFRALVGTRVPATPATFAAPKGDPAAPAVVEGVIATMREVIACHNADDFRRQAALYTDAGFAEDFAFVTDADVAYFAPTPVPLPPQGRLRLVAVQDVVVLDDGRVGAVVVAGGTPEGERDDYILFVEAGGRYLIDHFVDEYDRPIAGTPTP